MATRIGLPFLTRWREVVARSAGEMPDWRSAAIPVVPVPALTGASRPSPGAGSGGGRRVGPPSWRYHDTLICIVMQTTPTAQSVGRGNPSGPVGFRGTI